MDILEERESRLEELREAIQRGINSGEPTPLDIEAIKVRGHARLELIRKRLIKLESI